MSEVDKRRLKWIKRFSSIATKVSTWSKDPSSKIGAVAINDRFQILSTGYNGFPKGIKDTLDRYNDRNKKYHLILHAEHNLILNALYNKVSLEDSTVIVSGLPVCEKCALQLIQVGISTIVVRKKDISNSRRSWTESWEHSKSLFSESGVEIIFI